MKKTAIALLLALLLVAFSGCGSKNEPADSSSSEGSEVTQEESSSDESSEESSEESSNETSEESSEDSKETSITADLTPEGATVIMESPLTLTVKSAKEDLITFYTEKFAELGSTDAAELKLEDLKDNAMLASMTEEQLESVWLYAGTIGEQNVAVVLADDPATGLCAVSVVIA